MLAAGAVRDSFSGQERPPFSQRALQGSANMMQGAVRPLGTYIQQALQLGLSGNQAAKLLNKVHRSENGQLNTTQQQALVGALTHRSGQPRQWVERDVSALLNSAAAVPPTVEQPILEE